MDIEKLIERLKSKDFERDYDCTPFECGAFGLLDDAADALSTLQGENEEMQKQLNMFSEFLCYMTGGLLSKTNYTAQEMATAAEDYQQKVCGECDLRAENEKLRAELEQAKAERDAAIEDIDSILAKAELIRRQIGYCLDYDSDAELATLCVNYCKNNVCEMCYEEREDGGCGNFLWRGQKGG